MAIQTAQPGAALPVPADTAPADDQLADQAAPLDALLVDAAPSTLSRFAPDMSAAKLAVALARRPRTTGRRIGGLAAEFVRIGAGTSNLAPTTRDGRFADPAWTQNPLLRRIVQAYLAAGRTADELVGEAGLGSRDERRVRPPGNPKARHQTSKNNPANPADWLKTAQTEQGSWWPDLLTWLGDRCGPDKPAPEELGGGGLRPLVEAPGTYVFDT